MRWWYQSLISARMLFRRGRGSQRLDAELQYHLDQQIAENLAAGMPSETAPANPNVSAKLPCHSPATSPRCDQWFCSFAVNSFWW
ncbi:MAG TPA: permease prefix domain 1-containing protein [Terracidiphilus sp.]|nr:permease prefix domain 1-containing protein [Terracidiphilus sp.]